MLLIRDVTAIYNNVPKVEKPFCPFNSVSYVASSHFEAMKSAKQKNIASKWLTARQQGKMACQLARAKWAKKRCGSPLWECYCI